MATVLFLMGMSSAYAWDCKPGVNTTPCILNPADYTGSQNQTQTQTQQQGQKQQQTSSSSAASASNSESNSVSAATGNAVSDVGNVSGVGNTSINYERSAPSMGQGSLAIMGCSAAGNAGGSNTHGSAFLGFAWTPHDCYLFFQAAAYQAIGQMQAACEVLNHTHAMEKLHKDEGVALALCMPAPPPAIVQHDVPPVLCKDCVTREELDEKIRRSLIKETSK